MTSLYTHPIEPRIPGQEAPVSAEAGFSLIEIVMALVISTLVMVSLSGIVGQMTTNMNLVLEKRDALDDAQFAMDRMEQAVLKTERFLLPLMDNPATAWNESVHTVLAVTLDPTLDRDRDGIPDADNDRDGQVDEDLPKDMNNDGKAGILGIDDDNDGDIDESATEDDDEDDDDLGSKDEDWLDGQDNDGDGSIDEDMPADMNNDGDDGVDAVDDDGDGTTDENAKEDDDEDEDDGGGKDEDWIDSVVFFLSGTNLMERLPNPHATSGTDYVEHIIASDVNLFQVTRRTPGATERGELVDIQLEITTDSGESVSMTSTVRIGGSVL
ncbi:MAG: hypothetical protein HQL50_05695 [Magnetococcales bacterium]|nr:hypothetical protein [Magnetococcales bacterium]